MDLSKEDLSDLEGKAIASITSAMDLFVDMSQRFAKKVKNEDLSSYFYAKASLWDSMRRNFPDFVKQQSEVLIEEIKNRKEEDIN